MLGPEQERWLADSLGRSAGEGGWNLLGQTTLFGPRDFKPGAGQALWNDGWDGYAPGRLRLIDALRKHRVANPVLLGGDVHENWVGHVLADYADPASEPVGVEFLKLRLTIAEQWVESVPRRFAAEDQAQPLQSQLADHGKFHDLIGRSPAMVVLYEEIQKIAAVDATVLIEGETCTGKELVARAIHLSSRRASHTFLAVNCAGFTDSILGSQLFVLCVASVRAGTAALASGPMFPRA